MMKEEYKNEICPVCYAKFFEEDDVVVCPICGAPHHRSCYRYLGKCKYEQYHGTPLQWDKQHTRNASQESDGEGGDRVGVTCPNCGTVSGSGTLFCPNCGTPFGKNRTDYQPNFNRFPGYQPIFSDPLGGVDPRENVDGVSVSELASCVGQNSHIYLPRFIKLKKEGGKRFSWSWSAFLIPEYFFLYRRCIGAGIFALTLRLITTLMQFPFAQAVSSYQSTEAMRQALESGNIPQNYFLLAFIASLFILAYRLIFGVFGNLIYKHHCVRTVTEIHDKAEPAAVQAEIAKKGGVSLLLALIGSVAFEVIYYLVLLLL